MGAKNAIVELRGDPLPPDALVIRYDAREAMSTPYEVTVEFSTEDLVFKAEDCLRQRLMLTLVGGDGGQRHFEGVCDRAEFTFHTGTHFHFEVRLRPAIAALSRREDCRIYQNESAVDVVKKVLEAAGVDKTEWHLFETYMPREYIVQYRESELDFVHRLLEEEGIFYFFRHTPEGHVLVLADDPEAFVPFDDAPEVRFSMAQGVAGEPLGDFSRTRALRTSSVLLRDYDFTRPQQKPQAMLPAPEHWPMPAYEYPGNFTDSAAGQRRAKARLREKRRDADTVRGSSTAIGLRVGVPFLVEGAQQDCLNGEFVVVELKSSGEQTLESGGLNAVTRSEMIGIPAGAPYAPERRARRVRIRGIQTATVTGPSSDEQAIHVDKYGRVKVRFHWDRVGQQDDTSSCWLRVVQPPMGGSMILPRVGWEVAVAFFNGDPDQPFVLGRVYNAEKTPPYALPGSQTQGAVKSLSSPGGGGHNELMMADSGGSQGWNLHASKDLNVSVGHDKNETVGVDETHNVTVNMSVSIGSNESISVGANQSVDVGAVMSHQIGGGQSISVGGNETSNATANYVEKIGGDRSYTVGGNMTVISNTVMQTITGNMSKTVGTAMVAGSVASLADTVGGDMSENVGAVKIDLCKGTSSESVGGNKNLTSLAAELHLVKGAMSSSSDASVTQLVGGLHYEKIAGDFTVSAPIIALIGAIGDFKGGGSNVKLGGGPIVIKGSKVAIETALLVKLGGSLKMGA